MTDYPFVLRALSLEDGGGYLIEFPDLPGCMSDGETVDEAIAHGQDAVACWLKAAEAAGRIIPKPGSFELNSGKWVQRVPRWLHSRLVEKAKEEGVSLNTLVVSLLAVQVGRSSVHAKK